MEKKLHKAGHILSWIANWWMKAEVIVYETRLNRRNRCAGGKLRSHLRREVGHKKALSRFSLVKGHFQQYFTRCKAN